MDRFFSNKRILIITFSLLLSAGSLGWAQDDLGSGEPKRSSKASRGAPSPLLDLDSLLRGKIESGRVNGCSALIFHEGKETFYKHWGMSDAKSENPIQRDTIFRIYSMSKPITSIAVMQLVDAKKIDLDDPVAKYLPELSKLKVLVNKKGATEVDAERSITVRDLLRHTSGLSYGFFGNTEVDKRYRSNGVLMLDRDIETTVKKLGKLPLLHQPGTQFHYSVSTDVLGRLVEVVSEERLDNYFRDHIFKPLGMNDTFFNVPKNKRERLAKLYEPAGKGRLKESPVIKSARFLNPENLFFSGGGGLCSTMDDYLAFAKMLLGKGELNGRRVVSENAIDQMFKNQLSDIKRPPGQFKFGLGFSISRRGDRGWGGAAGTKFWVNPDKKLIAIYMTQIMPNRGHDFADEVIRAAHRSIDD